MSIPVGVILAWPGAHASIPSGWGRETSLDGKFPKVWGTEVPNVPGGTATHSHTSDAHVHTMISHSHTVATGTSVNNSTRGNNSGSSATWVFHSHPSTVAGVVGGSLTDAVTYVSTDTLPPFYEVIFISPSSNPKLIPDDVIALWNDADVPDGFAMTDGTGGTIDLRNKYLRGASALADAGTGGGSLNHSHTVNHTHTTRSHSHSATSGNATPTDAGTGAGSPVAGQHQHSITLPSANSATGAYSGSAGSADDVEVAYYKLLAIQNTSGGNLFARVGIIGLWLGSADDIPLGWALCDGDNDTPNLVNKYIKIANTTGEIGDTGGSNTHTHAASNSHTHTATGTHTHATGGYLGYYGTNVSGISGGSDNNSDITHRHSISTVSSTTATYNSQTISANVSNNEPEYLTAAYIMHKWAAGGAALFALM